MANAKVMDSSIKIALYCKSVKQHQIPSLYNMNETSF